MIHGSSSLQIPALSDHDTQAEQTGVPLMHHATGTAALLFTLNMNAESIAATILFTTPKYIDNWQ